MTGGERMTKKQILVMMEQLQLVFDVVRLVDVSVMTQISLAPDGTIVRQPYQYYAIWNRSRRCENCISAKALSLKTRLMKFEFKDHEVYHVIAKYVEIEGTPFLLEMITHITDDTVFGAYGRGAFAETIASYNHKLYTDPVTDTHNRQYYEEQLSGLTQDALAMLDADDFKQINDTYGHAAGDQALRAISRTVLSCTRPTDALVRYGGDEFVICFRNIPRNAFAARLEQIRRAVEEIRLPDWPQLRLTVSIGGVYDHQTTDELVHVADEMLYRAKARKNAIEIR